MDRSRLPLTAIRAFEAAARYESFTKAAQELAVTHSAVSRQVQQLETQLGLRLFERMHRQIRLTATGRQFAQRVSAGLNEISAAFDAVTRGPRRETLRVAVDSDVAQLWLLHLLREFEDTSPSTQVTVTAEQDLADLPDHADCAIAWGHGWWRDCLFEPLFSNWAFPVASPALVNGAPGLHSPTDLGRHRLIHDRDTRWWEMVATAFELTDLDWTAGTVFNQTVLCLEAAAAGEGVTVGDEVTTRQYLAEGRLAVPFDIRLPSPLSCFFLFRARDEERPHLRRFREWIAAHAGQHRAWFLRYWNSEGPTIDPRLHAIATRHYPQRS